MMFKHTLTKTLTICAVAIMAISQVAFAQETLTVTKTDDTDDGVCDDDCSLREAIAVADTGDIVDIPAGVYTLTLGSEIVVTKSLTLKGSETGSTIIQAATTAGTAGFRVFTLAGADNIISHLTIRHGHLTTNVRGAGLKHGGNLTILNCTISNNQASWVGGGIHSGGSDVLTIINSTISDNTAGYGGAIFMEKTPQLYVENSTFSNNSAAYGGNIYHYSNDPTPPQLTNTILAKGVSGTNCLNYVISNGYNIDDDGSCGFSGTGDISNTDPMLGSLQDNGGPTFTNALLSGSPAIDAGDDATAPEFDQRGFVRIGVSDIGSFEYNGVAPANAILSISPPSIDFSYVLVGETATEQVTVKNTGTADLNVASISINGIDSLNFTVDTTPFILVPDDSLFLVVNFTPDDTGSFSASLDIDSDGGSASVTLTGTGVAPKISITPISVDFGDVLVGETATEQVTVKNTGTADLNVASISINGIDSLNFTVDTTPFTLVPDDSLFLVVNFTPDDTGSFTASLDIESDGGSASVTLTGTGVAPKISITPLLVDFGDVIVGETTTEQVTVKNTGTADLNVSSIAITGVDSLNFNVDTTSFTLTPGDSVLLDVSFTPDDTGSFSASLDIESDGGSANVVLSGNDIIDPAASIVSIIDVPDDQGGWVYLRWFSSLYDTSGEITQYGIWELNPEDEWVSSGNVPAIQEDYYIYLAHTFGDSTDEGIFWSAFMVTAHTPDPEVFFESAVDSGYSIDNLAPAVPTGLLAAVTEENTVELTWDSPVDEDFDYFKIYRSLEPDFDPIGLEPFAETIDTTFIDSDVEIGDTLYYRISAVDFNGNESEYSEAVEATVVLSIDDLSGIPIEFGLHQNYPNPFNPVTTLCYDLPEQADVTLIIYDLLGREVKTLISGIVVSGYHAVVWDGTNSAGESVGAGVYLYRISSDKFTKVNKMILLR